ncbi:MAG: hypothetical protein RL591_1390 [Planctomycetota bacterium]
MFGSDLFSQLSPTTALLLVLAGICCGFLNTVASSGSAVTLPLMISLGLPPLVANATNRVPVVVGLAVAVWKFHRSGQIRWREGLMLAFPTVLGAVIGTFVAVSLGNVGSGYLTTVAVLFSLGLVLSNPTKWLHADQQRQAKKTGPFVHLALFAVGIWTGLIVLDSGTLFLAVLILLAHFPIREANAIKVLTMGMPSLIAVVIFTLKGDINWAWAIPLSVGGIFGSLIGAKLSIGPHASRWIFWTLVTVLGFQGIHLALQFVWAPTTT